VMDFYPCTDLEWNWHYNTSCLQTIQTHNDNNNILEMIMIMNVTT
jgi:hypothetical protein